MLGGKGGGDLGRKHHLQHPLAAPVVEPDEGERARERLAPRADPAADGELLADEREVALVAAGRRGPERRRDGGPAVGARVRGD